MHIHQHMCIDACMLVYMYVRIHAYAGMHACINMHMNAFMLTSVCGSTACVHNVHVYTCMHMYPCMRETYMNAVVRTCVWESTYVHMYMYTYLSMYA
jgi:hypothetical protein